MCVIRVSALRKAFGTVKAVDGVSFDDVRTSLDGVLEVDITPKTYGIQKLVLQNENNEIIRTLYLEFAKKLPFKKTKQF